MRIAFYAPLKSPNHPIVSGDREMARLLIRALEMAGHEVAVASELRVYLGAPEEAKFEEFQRIYEAELQRLLSLYREIENPDLWFAYHPYYKSPDLIGPTISRALGIPYVTAEASLSSRRNVDAWARTQEIVADCIRMASANICLTARDKAGLAQHAPAAKLVELSPFIDAAPWAKATRRRDAHRLVTVAMMRKGDKLDSYRFLAEALDHIRDGHWTLDVIGEGECRDEVASLFAPFEEHVTFHGQCDATGIRDIFSRCGTFVWPGCGEAYGIAYLEAQASGLPVVAQATAGVPEVVKQGETGLLTVDGDATAFAGAIMQLIHNPDEHGRLAANAARFVTEERSLPVASVRLDRIIRRAVETA